MMSSLFSDKLYYHGLSSFEMYKLVPLLMSGNSGYVQDYKKLACIVFSPLLNLLQFGLPQL